MHMCVSTETFVRVKVPFVGHPGAFSAWPRVVKPSLLSVLEDHCNRGDGWH